jgi:enamine deaminase RidA (YjgF/YER057c/UK114 family)
VTIVSPVECIQFNGCSVTLRQVEGPGASELFFHCQPPPGSEPSDQANSAYTAILEVLDRKGGTYSDVVTETCFMANMSQDLPAWREARSAVLADAGAASHKPAITEIGQAPLTGQQCAEILIHAVIPTSTPVTVDTFSARTACDCAECARTHAIRVNAGTETRLFSGGIYGAGDSAFEQTTNMFEVAETMLQQAGMNFSDVMRTWIYFPEMERDYAEFNRARRQFFESRGIDPVPASTGIGGRLASPDHKLCLGIYAVASTPPAERVVMTTPTLNEAPEYGSDFSRGMRVPETNKVSLLISGTASLDVTGATVCVGDFEGQARRMLLNVEALLKAQGASFDEVVSAITYVKHAEDAHRLQAIFQEVGYDRFPNVIVAAEVCRPELLCETELVAVKSRGNA